MKIKSYSTLIIVRGFDYYEEDIIKDPIDNDMPEDYIEALKKKGYAIVYRNNPIIILEKQGKTLKVDSFLYFQFNEFRENLDNEYVLAIEDTSNSCDD